MGKKDFKKTHYAAACKDLYSGKVPTLKVSQYSDVYKPGCNFAIVIMYSWKGKFKWFNAYKGQKGRFLYVAFQNTDEWTADNFRAAGQGMVHDFIFKDTFGEDYSLNKASCGGAGIKDGKLKFSSAWLNNTTSNDASFKHKWKTDGSKLMSNAERVLIKFATQKWMRHGIHKKHTIPTKLHNYLRGKRKSSGERLLDDGIPVKLLNTSRAIRAPTKIHDASRKRRRRDTSARTRRAPARIHDASRKKYRRHTRRSHN